MMQNQIKRIKRNRTGLFCAALVMLSSPIFAALAPMVDEVWNDSIRLNRRYYPSEGRAIYRGSFGPTLDPGPRKIKWMRSSMGISSTPNSCGGIDFDAQFKLNFNKHAASEFVKGLKDNLMQLAGSAPMMLLEIIDPNLASFLKNLNTNTLLNLETNMASCEKMADAVSGIGRQMFAQRRSSCIEEQTKGGRISMEQALRACGGDYTQVEKFLNNPMGPVVPIVASINDWLSKSMGDGWNPLYADLVESVVGVTELKGTDVTISSKIKRKPIKDVMLPIQKEVNDSFNQAVESVTQDVIPANRIMDDLSTDLVPISVGVLRDALDLPDDQRDMAISNIIKAISARRCEVMIENLTKAMKGMNMRTDVKIVDESKVTDIKAAIADLEEQKKLYREEAKVATEHAKLYITYSEEAEKNITRKTAIGEEVTRGNEFFYSARMGGFGQPKWMGSNPGNF